MPLELTDTNVKRMFLFYVSIFISFLKIIDCKYMYLNGFENNFHSIHHTVFMTDHCNSYSYAWRTSDRTAVIKSNF